MKFGGFFLLEIEKKAVQLIAMVAKISVDLNKVICLCICSGQVIAKYTLMEIKDCEKKLITFGGFF